MLTGGVWYVNITHANGRVEKSGVVQCFFPARAADMGSVYHATVYVAHVPVPQTNQNIPEIFRSTVSRRRNVILCDLSSAVTVSTTSQVILKTWANGMGRVDP